MQRGGSSAGPLAPWQKILMYFLFVCGVGQVTSRTAAKIHALLLCMNLCLACQGGPGDGFSGQAAYLSAGTQPLALVVQPLTTM